MSRRVIPGKKVTHKDVTISSEKDGKVEIQISGQPPIELTHEEYVRLQDLMDDVTKWHDHDDE